jgi:Glycosyl hydrolases family 25
MLLPDFSENQSSGAPNWTPTPDFAGVKRKNGGAAIIRVSYGIDHRDHCFIRNRRAAQHHKYAFLGLYQYVTAGDIAAQARAFCRWVGELAPNEIPIADIEEGSGDQDRRAEKWFDIVDRKLGLSDQKIERRSWLYSGENRLTTQFARVCASGRPIWVAAYRDEEPTLGHILWQSTGGDQTNSGEPIGSHQIPWPGCGRKCDTNLYHGTLKKLAAATARDDLPYPKKDILDIVRKGVAAELGTGLDGTGITPAQAAKAAVQGQQALAELARQVADLTEYLKQHLPDLPSMEHAGTR